jgi:hypothetical protein
MPNREAFDPRRRGLGFAENAQPANNRSATMLDD